MRIRDSIDLGYFHITIESIEACVLEFCFCFCNNCNSIWAKSLK